MDLVNNLHASRFKLFPLWFIFIFSVFCWKPEVSVNELIYATLASVIISWVTNDLYPPPHHLELIYVTLASVIISWVINDL